MVGSGHAERLEVDMADREGDRNPIGRLRRKPVSKSIYWSKENECEVGFNSFEADWRYPPYACG
jgi:hypothetical protein